MYVRRIPVYDVSLHVSLNGMVLNYTIQIVERLHLIRIVRTYTFKTRS